jgi:hypothetical protein
MEWSADSATERVRKQNGSANHSAERYANCSTEQIGQATEIHFQSQDRTGNKFPVPRLEDKSTSRKSSLSRPKPDRKNALAQNFEYAKK